MLTLGLVTLALGVFLIGFGGVRGNMKIAQLGIGYLAAGALILAFRSAITAIDRHSKRKYERR